MYFDITQVNTLSTTKILKIKNKNKTKELATNGSTQINH